MIELDVKERFTHSNRRRFDRKGNSLAPSAVRIGRPAPTPSAKRKKPFLKDLWHRFRTQLASVTAYPVGDSWEDGVARPLYTSGTDIDKTWGEIYNDQLDAAELWETHPYATRTIEITTAFVVGSGISLTSTDPKVAEFIDMFWNHDQNDMDDRLSDLADELWRSGELFITLHPNPMAAEWYIRPIPACTIEGIEWKKGDYETELRYIQTPEETGQEPIKWWSPRGLRMHEKETKKMMKDEAICLHFTINKRVGAIRGQSDLMFISDWLEYYKTWLEDRVRLNGAIRYFLLWFKVRRGQAQRLRERLQKPPEAGTIMVEEDGIELNAVAPNLNARDSQDDGRQIRLAIAAGTRGLSLTDFGETDTANLATAKATAENRRRFMLRRQAKFATVMRAIVVETYNRSIETGRISGKPIRRNDIGVSRADISTTDNELIANALNALVTSFKEMIAVCGHTPELVKLCLTTYLRYAEEKVTEEDFEAMLKGDRFKDFERMNPAPQEQDGGNSGGNGNGNGNG